MFCIFCNKNKKTEDHFCRAEKQQRGLENIHDELIKLLVEENRSIYSIQNESIEKFGFAISGHQLRTWCTRNNIPNQSIRQRANSPQVREKYKKTVMKKYGVENVSQSSIIKNKKISVNQFRYGCVNQFQRPEIKEKSKQTMLEKYGVENPIHLPSRNSHTGCLSKPHKMVSEYLSKNEIYHLNEKKNLFKIHNSILNRVYSPIVDIWIPSYNYVIEIYGDYWHASPLKYYSTDIIARFKGPMTAEEIWNYDNMRIAHISSFGVKVKIVWEHELKNVEFIDSIIYDMREWSLKNEKKAGNILH